MTKKTKCFPYLALRPVFRKNVVPKFVAKIDHWNAYWQYALDKRSRDKTTVFPT